MNIFDNSNLILVFSAIMDSKHFVDNFQPLFDARIATFQIKKMGKKLTIFDKTNF